MVDVGLHRSWADVEFDRDLAVGQTCGYQPKHLDLSFGQRFGKSTIDCARSRLDQAQNPAELKGVS